MSSTEKYFKQQDQTSPTLSKISMLISAILMGSVGLVVSALAKFPVYTITLLRGISGTFFLSLFMIKFNSFSKNFLKRTFKLHWKPLIAIGIVNPLIIFFYFLNITISGYAIAAFLLYTSGIFVLIFLIVGNIEKVEKINIFSFILAVIGVALIMEFWSGQGLTDGIILGLISGITMAIYIFATKLIFIHEKKEKYVNNEGDLNTFIAWWSTLFIIFLFLPLGYGDLFQITAIDLIIILILGFFPTALAFILYNIGLRKDVGGNIIILSYFEPVVATIISIFTLQILTIYTILGGTLILVANIMVLLFSNKASKNNIDEG